jgi:uncharacterized protein DUF3105
VRRTKIVAIALAAALAAPVPAWLALRGDGEATSPADQTLAGIASAAGCRLTELERARATNPPVTGRVDERVTAQDGSYVGRSSPSTLASTHALLHGRVLLQYQPELPAAQVASLQRFVLRDPEKLLLFANRTGMPQPVAATAYLTLMTCPRVDARTLVALRAFVDRRRDFGQAF